MANVEAIRQRFRSVRDTLNERSLRRWAGAEALAMGRGGMAAVHRITDLAHKTIARGMREAQDPPDLDAERVRAPGAGRKCVEDVDPDLRPALEALV